MKLQKRTLVKVGRRNVKNNRFYMQRKARLITRRRLQSHVMSLFSCKHLLEPIQPSFISPVYESEVDSSKGLYTDAAKNKHRVSELDVLSVINLIQAKSMEQS